MAAVSSWGGGGGEEERGPQGGWDRAEVVGREAWLRSGWVIRRLRFFGKNRMDGGDLEC